MSIKHFLTLLFSLILAFTIPQAASAYTKYLTEYFKDFKEFTIVKLQGGTTKAKNYKITTKEKDYVLRILDPNTSSKERHQEIEAAAYAGKLEIGPRIFYTDSNHEAMIMEFVKGETLNPFLLKDKAVLRACLQHMQRLHRSRGSFPQGLTVFERIKLRLQNLKQSSIPFPAKAIDEALTKLCDIEKIFQTHSLVPCHNDLNALNVILEGRAVKFIDWTDAGIGYAYNDLGYFILINQIGEERYEEVLTSYLGVLPSSQEICFLKLMKKVSMLRIFATIFPEHEPAILDLEQRKNRSVQLENLLSDAHLLPISYFIDMHINGKLQGQELIRSAISSLREFLSDER